MSSRELRVVVAVVALVNQLPHDRKHISQGIAMQKGINGKEKGMLLKNAKRNWKEATTTTTPTLSYPS
jgi:hypothetical protein